MTPLSSINQNRLGLVVTSGPAFGANRGYPLHDPPDWEAIVSLLLGDPTLWDPKQLTFSELLHCLPGKHGLTLPEKFTDKTEGLLLRSLLFLTRKSAVQRPTAKEQKLIEAALLTILKNPEAYEHYSRCAALSGVEFYYTPAFEDVVFNALLAENSEIAGTARKILIRHAHLAMEIRIKTLLKETLAREQKGNHTAQFHSSIPILVSTLKQVLPDASQLIPFLQSIDAMPLHLRKIHSFNLENGQYLTGEGITGCVLDTEFDKDHEDFGNNIFLLPETDLDDEHGTQVVSTWAGQAAGAAPTTRVIGLGTSGTTVEHLAFWTQTLLKAAEDAQNGRLHPRIFSLSVAPDLSDIKTDGEKKAYEAQLQKWHAACALAFKENIVVLITADNKEAAEPILTKEGGQLPPFSLNPYVLRVGACEVFDENTWLPTSYSGRGGQTFHPSFLAPTRRLAAVHKTHEVFHGTSCSTPFAAGVVSLLLQANPTLTSAEVFHCLTTTASPITGVAVSQQGAGVICPEGAIAWALEKTSLVEARRFKQFMKKD